MRKCAARNCVLQIDHKWLMCPPHWATIPPEMRANVNRSLYTYARTVKTHPRYAEIKAAYFTAVKKAIEFYYREETL